MAQELISFSEAARLRGVTKQAIAGMVKRKTLQRIELYDVPFVRRADVIALPPKPDKRLNGRRTKKR